MTCLKVCVLLLVASCAFASPSRICLPDQFEAETRTTTGYIRGQNHGVSKVYEKLHFDFTNSRSTSLKFETSARGTYRTLSVMRYSGKTGMAYMLDLDTNKCYFQVVTSPFKQICLPDNATYMGTGDIGPLGKLTVTFYATTDGSYTQEMSVVKQGNAYVPVHTTTIKDKGDDFYIRTGEVYNLTTGITDPMVFNIPPNCQKTHMSQKRSASLFEF